MRCVAASIMRRSSPSEISSSRFSRCKSVYLTKAKLRKGVASMARVRLASVFEVPEDGMIARDHEGRTVMLAKVDGKIYAMDNTCTHAGAPLNDGILGREQGSPYLLTCPWHAAHFDIRTGKVYQETPWAVDTETFPVSVEGEDIFVEL